MRVSAYVHDCMHDRIFYSYEYFHFQPPLQQNFSGKMNVIRRVRNCSKYWYAITKYTYASKHYRILDINIPNIT